MKKAPQRSASAHQRRGSRAGAGATGADEFIISLRSRFQSSPYDPASRRNSSVARGGARETATRTSGPGPTLRRWVIGSRAIGIIEPRPKRLHVPDRHSSSSSPCSTTTWRRAGDPAPGRARARAQLGRRAWRSPPGGDRERARRRRSRPRSSERVGEAEGREELGVEEEVHVGDQAGLDPDHVDRRTVSRRRRRRDRRRRPAACSRASA